MSFRHAGERIQKRVAIIGLVLVALIIVVSLSAQNIPFLNGGAAYYAEFSDAAGLQAGEAVTVAGVQVGRVTDVRLDGDKVRVAFTVDGMALGDRTTASIEIKTLLGQHYLNVTPAGTTSLPEGATIPLSRTSTPLNLVPALEQFTTQVQAIDTKQVANAFETLASTMHATTPELGDALRGLGRLSTSVSSRDQQIRDLLTRAREVSGVVADRDSQIGQLLTASDQVLQTLNERREVINRLILGTTRVAHQLSGLVKDNPQLGDTLTKLNRVLVLLNQNKANFAQIMKYGGAYAREFTNVGGDGHWFEATTTFPRNFALCVTQSSNPQIGALLGQVFANFSKQVNGTNQPCLPLGPATGDAK